MKTWSRRLETASAFAAANATGSRAHRARTVRLAHKYCRGRCLENERAVEDPAKSTGGREKSVPATAAGVRDADNGEVLGRIVTDELPRFGLGSAGPDPIVPRRVSWDPAILDEMRAASMPLVTDLPNQSYETNTA